MGSSNTIADQMQKNAEFQQYVETQQQALNKITDAAHSTLASNITNYYKAANIDDAQPLVSGENSHLSTASEWSLKNVADMIGSVHDAIFGAKSAPQGATLTQQDAAVAANLAKLSSLEVLITSTVFTTIQGILMGFASGSQTSVQQQYATKEIVPGLTLFLATFENQFQSTSYFSNEVIIENVYVYDVRFSVKQAAAIANFDRAQSLISEQSVFEANINQCTTQIGSLDVTADDYDVKYAKYTGMISSLNDQLDVLQAEIAKAPAAPAQNPQP